MNDHMPWYKSQVLISQVVAFVAAAAAFFNYQFDFNLEEVITQIFAGVGAVMAVWAFIARLRKPNPNLTAAADAKERELRARGAIP